MLPCCPAGAHRLGRRGRARQRRAGVRWGVGRLKRKRRCSTCFPARSPPHALFGRWRARSATLTCRAARVDVRMSTNSHRSWSCRCLERCRAPPAGAAASAKAASCRAPPPTWGRAGERTSTLVQHPLATHARDQLLLLPWGARRLLVPTSSALHRRATFDPVAQQCSGMEGRAPAGHVRLRVRYIHGWPSTSDLSATPPGSCGTLGRAAGQGTAARPGTAAMHDGAALLSAVDGPAPSLRLAMAAVGLIWRLWRARAWDGVAGAAGQSPSPPQHQEPGVALPTNGHTGAPAAPGGGSGSSGSQDMRGAWSGRGAGGGRRRQQQQRRQGGRPEGGEETTTLRAQAAVRLLAAAELEGLEGELQGLWDEAPVRATHLRGRPCAATRAVWTARTQA